VVHLDKFQGVLDELMKLAGQIKAAGQKTEAENLIKKYVDSDKVPQALIKERVQRYSKASFVYGWKI
jgi:Na+/phosphate symporter